MKKSEKMRKLVESLEPKKKEFKAADINKDGKVDEKDLSEVHKAYHKEKEESEKEESEKEKPKKKQIRSKKK